MSKSSPEVLILAIDYLCKFESTYGLFDSVLCASAAIEPLDTKERGSASVEHKNKTLIGRWYKRLFHPAMLIILGPVMLKISSL